MQCHHATFIVLPAIFLMKALEIRLNKLGSQHPNTAASYNNIGNAFKSKGELDKALENFEKALEIRLEKLGPSHPETLNRSKAWKVRTVLKLASHCSQIYVPYFRSSNLFVDSD